MGIFDGLGNLFHGIAHFLAGGGGNNAPTTVSTTTQVSRPQNQGQTATQTAAAQEDILPPELKLFQGVLQKAAQKPATPAPSPAATVDPNALVKASLSPGQQRAQDTVDKLGGPVDPNYVSKNPGVLQDAQEAVKGALNLPKNINDNINHSPLLVKAVNSVAGSAVQDPNSTLSNPVMPNSLIKAAGNMIGNTDPYIGELANPGSYAKGGANLLNSGINLAKSVPGALAKVASAIKNVPGTLANEVGTLTKAPDELAAGIKSVNPTQAADATAAHVASIPDEHLAPDAVAAATAPPPPSPADIKAAAEQAARQAPVTADAMHPNETDILTKLNEAAKTRVLNPVEKDTQAALQAKQDAITASNAPVNPASPSGKAAPSPRKTAPAPAEPPTAPASGAVPLESPNTAPTPGAPETSTPIGQNSSSAENVAQTQNNVNPLNPSGKTAPNAPELRASLEKQLKEAGAPVDQALKDNPKATGEHDVLSNDQLNEAADRVISTMNDDELVNTYKTGAKFQNAAEVAQGNAALKRLGELKIAGNTDAAQAIENILEGAAKVTSEGGRTLNYAQSMYDNLPRPAKVSYLIRSIDRLRAKGNEAKFPPIGGAAGDVAEKARIEREFDGLLKTSEDLKQSISESEARIQQIAADGGDQKAAAAEINKLRAAIDKAKLEYSANDGKAEQLYDSLVPKAPAGERAGDLGRTLMLSSPTGRANDLLTTGLNVAHTVVSQTGEALVGKALNAGRALLGKTPGKYVSKAPSLSTVIKGGATGLQKSAGEFKGNVYAGDLMRDIKSGNAGGKTGLMRASNGPVAAVKRFIRAGAEMATNASEGIKDAQIERLADQEGRQMGLKGDALKAHIAERMALPTKVMQDNATQLHEEVNNINDNPISGALGKVASAISNLGGSDKGAASHAMNAVGEQFRNLAIPFTKWAGGQAWNAITDKNVIANATKLVTQVVKGATGKGVDSQEVVSQLAKLGTNAALSMTLGYKMAQAGLLTTSDAEGYNDDGLYLHVGGRYIPAATLGFLAPSMILGASTYHGFNDDSAKPTSEKIAATAQNVFEAGWKSYLSNTIIGDQNAVTKAATLASNPNSNVTGGDVAATAAGQAVGQYIPAVTGDINAILNNYSSLNPTHEKADTSPQKVNPKTGNMVKDYLASTVAGLQNKVPMLSQGLPRKAGVAAPDLIDRVMRGSRDTATSVKEQADAKDKADQATADKAGDIPDPNGKYKNGDSFESAVQARIDRGEYDKASKGLQQKLDTYKDDPNVAKKTTDALEMKVKELGVLKAGHYDPSIIDDYKNTSVADWRKMGDPEADEYDQKKFDLLWQYDNQLAKAGASGDPHDPTDTKFSVKPPGKGRSGSKGDKAITSNTLGATPNLKPISFGALAPQKVSAAATIPTIQQIKPSDLIKKRTISVKKA